VTEIANRKPTLDSSHHLQNTKNSVLPIINAGTLHAEDSTG